MVATRPVHARYAHPDDTPVTGKAVTFEASPTAILDPNDQTIFIPPVTAYTDRDGNLTTTLICTDDPTLNPTGFTYQVTEQGERQYNIAVPTDIDNTILELADVAPIPAANGVAIWRGPPGEPAPGFYTGHGLPGVDVAGVPPGSTYLDLDTDVIWSSQEVP